MYGLHLLRAVKESGHKWNPSMERDRRGAALKGNIFVASGATRKDQDEPTVLQNVDGSLDRTWRRATAVNRKGTAKGDASLTR
jgi:hypothetical protein